MGSDEINLKNSSVWVFIFGKYCFSTPIPQAGFTADVAPPGDLGAALVARTVLYWTACSAHRRPPLPARRILARSGLHPANVGAALHDWHAAPSWRRLLRLPLGASLACPGGGCGPGNSARAPLPHVWVWSVAGHSFRAWTQARQQ